VQLLNGAARRDPIVDAGDVVQRWAATLLDHTGVPVVAALFGLLLLGALVRARSVRTRSGPALPESRSDRTS
jgi:hypothetical protein